MVCDYWLNIFKLFLAHYDGSSFGKISWNMKEKKINATKK